MKFGRSIPNDIWGQLDPQVQAQIILNGGRPRSQPGAPMSERDTMSNLGVARGKNQTGLSGESNWNNFFKKSDKVDPVTGFAKPNATRQAFRQPPVVPNNGMQNPVADVPPQVNPLQQQNIDQTGDYWWMNPLGPDLSTPDALMADATQTSTNFLNRKGHKINPVPGQVKSGTSLKTPYGTASVRNSWDTEWAT
jgi:hypothetical protein